MRLDVDIQKRVTAPGRSFDVAVHFATDTHRLALYGPSGAGKTLTLQMLAGLLRPDAGRIVADGVTWFDAKAGIDVPPRGRRVGYVFQDYALFPHWTVEQNLGAAFARAWPRRLSTAKQMRIERALASFELTEIRDSYPAQVSGGQRQRHRGRTGVRRTAARAHAGRAVRRARRDAAGTAPRRAPLPSRRATTYRSF